MKNITILGSTGSIGVSTLDVCNRHQELFNVVALTANNDVEKLLKQCLQFKPRYAVMADSDAALKLEASLRQNNLSTTQVLAGNEGLEYVAGLEENDMVMAAIVGAAGLMPALSAVKAGKKLLLANKEALVVSGHLFMDMAKRCDAQILPIDSEHNAIYQCMPINFSQGLANIGVSQILLTASGGPFLDTPAEDLKTVTPEQAVAHPNWDMGKKISVDSATMMNKGLEVIEARWLFSASPNDIEVVIHPQSVIHSMVQYVDGSVLAQLGNPDMRTPIAHAMAWPERIQSGVKKLDLFEIARLDFFEPDYQRFPCLRLAFESLDESDSATAILNAANEIAVDAFLSHRIGFNDIPAINEELLNTIASEEANSIEQLLEIDAKTRKLASELVEKWSI